MDYCNIYDNVHFSLLLCSNIQLYSRYNSIRIISPFYNMENDIHITKLIIIFLSIIPIRKY